MNDRPAGNELLDAVRLFLEKELLPTLDDARLRFQTLIAINVLTIAGREWANEEPSLVEEYLLLAGLLGESKSPPGSLQALRQAVREGNEKLCQRIRSGALEAQQAEGEALKVVQQLVRRKLEIAHPRYLEKPGEKR